MRARIGAAVVLGVVVILIGAFVAIRGSDTPESHVARYLAATSAGDMRDALLEWSVYDTHRNVPASDPLLVRRNDLTAELAAAHVGRDYTVTRIAWWRTCCEPGEIADASNAGLARVHVTTHGADGSAYYLVFEVWVKDLTYWGDAMGSPTRDWRLYEVHRETDQCLFGGSAFACARAG